MSSFDLYQTVTDQIVTMLEAGVVPWRSPILGRSSAGHPKNLNTGKQYRGVNVFLLAFTAYAKGYGSSYWMTFNQAKERGGNVRKGEKSSMVVFWKQYETKDKQTGEAVRVPVLRYYNVFNAEQLDGIEAPDAVKFEPLDFKPIESAEQIAAGYLGSPIVTNDGGQQAFYRPATDTVHMPEKTRFATVEEYYSTLFHELSHSTGHSSRLDRKIDTDPKPFGSSDYGKEELVAEMSAAFLCSHAGIYPTVIGNQAAYLAGWLKQLKSDKKLVISAAGQAQRSADWIRGERGQPAETQTAEAA
jgi:antirestriction protein ArdC